MACGQQTKFYTIANQYHCLSVPVTNNTHQPTTTSLNAERLNACNSNDGTSQHQFLRNPKHSFTNSQCPWIWDLLLKGKRKQNSLALPNPLWLWLHWKSHFHSFSPPSNHRVTSGSKGLPQLTIGPSNRDLHGPSLPSSNISGINLHQKSHVQPPQIHMQPMCHMQLPYPWNWSSGIPSIPQTINSGKSHQCIQHLIAPCWWKAFFIFGIPLMSRLLELTSLLNEWQLQYQADQHWFF